MPFKLKTQEKIWRRKYNARHKKHRRALAKARYVKYKKAYKARAKAWRKANPERYSNAMKRWRKKNPKRAAFLSRRWCKKNRKRVKRNYRNWWHKNQMKLRSSRLKCSYGITLENFFELQKKQKNKCAICRNTFDKTPHVDHSHQTGAIRGLLCGHCNRGLGMFKDSLETLKFAMKYLKCSQKIGGRA